MEKHSLSMIINDLRSRRDALSLAHENLKNRKRQLEQMCHCHLSYDWYA